MTPSPWVGGGAVTLSLILHLHRCASHSAYHPSLPSVFHPSSAPLYPHSHFDLFSSRSLPSPPPPTLLPPDPLTCCFLSRALLHFHCHLSTFSWDVYIYTETSKTHTRICILVLTTPPHPHHTHTLCVNVHIYCAFILITALRSVEQHLQLHPMMGKCTLKLPLEKKLFSESDAGESSVSELEHLPLQSLVLCTD